MPLYDPSASGPHDPATATPPRAPRSIRRTTSIDTTRPDGLGGRMVMQGRARDLLTTVDSRPVVVDDAQLRAEAEGVTRTLVAISTEPALPALRGLVGGIVGPGFRARVDGVAPDERDARTLRYLLLDDLPGAALVSGYALLAGDAVRGGRNDEYLTAAADMCAGWAADGSMMQLIREHGQNPTPLGPPAPLLTPSDDPIALHDLPALPPHSTRRFRRVDVLSPLDDSALNRVEAFLRDTHVDAGGVETVLHEYTVRAGVDAGTQTIEDIDAIADVLPWKECPAAVGSAARLLGRPLGDLRPHVRSTFVGTSTCTHLNDVLRGLADVELLLDHL